jgi:hypothetical protein
MSDNRHSVNAQGEAVGPIRTLPHGLSESLAQEQEDEFLDRRAESPGIQIFATDVSERVREIACKGVSDQAIEADVSGCDR